MLGSSFEVWSSKGCVVVVLWNLLWFNRTGLRSLRMPGIECEPLPRASFRRAAAVYYGVSRPPTLPEGYGREDLFWENLGQAKIFFNHEDFCALEAVSRNGDVMMAGLAKSTEPAYIFRTALSRRRWDGLGLHPNQSVGEIGQKGLPRCSAQSCKRSSR